MISNYHVISGELPRLDWYVDRSGAVIRSAVVSSEATCGPYQGSSDVAVVSAEQILRGLLGARL